MAICASKTCASSSPIFSSACFFIRAKSCFDFSNALLKRNFSFLQFALLILSNFKFGSVRTYAVAIEIPLLAAIPFNLTDIVHNLLYLIINPYMLNLFFQKVWVIGSNIVYTYMNFK
ncbi:hypothetical protein FD16_GL002046 [Paucilactobacillus suebicus DSM 5007 = KCTC 3549]|uniref:Uncharacterized protein n=1 Tax=Paucilactobacillus suebicus DSM 5007 = KCTC 3549 TaxID=1423807 RepID=A0A0R1VTH5_9LACO|nr:hypothetical protein FD16_GL002046 [Paucilactobacillus suebicus DSM 5007 = KCTC 3549]